MLNPNINRFQFDWIAEKAGVDKDVRGTIHCV